MCGISAVPTGLITGCHVSPAINRRAIFEASGNKKPVKNLKFILYFCGTPFALLNYVENSVICALAVITQ